MLPTLIVLLLAGYAGELSYVARYLLAGGGAVPCPAALMHGGVARFCFYSKIDRCGIKLV